MVAVAVVVPAEDVVPAAAGEQPADAGARPAEADVGVLPLVSGGTQRHISDDIQRAVVLPPPAVDVRRTVLPNGVRVLTDRVADAPSATLAVWAGVGGRDESAEGAGSSHFLEHLLFKGTDRRNALDIALDIDGVGGDMNAYTSSEYTAYYARVPASEYEVASDILLDVVAEPALRPDEFDGEREVILEELAAADDDPEDLVGVRLFEAMFPGDPLGREVLGSVESIESLTRDDVAGFFSTWYCPTNLVVTGSGQVDHDRLVDEVAARFGDAAPGTSPTRNAPSATVETVVRDDRGGELAHLALGWRTAGAHGADRFALTVLNHVLGSGPSSRLFQTVREERGLTYSIASGLTHYSDAGALTVQCAMSPSKAAELLEVVEQQIDQLRREGIRSDELSRAKRSLRGSLVMGLEDSGTRGARLGISEIVRGEVVPLATHLDMIDAVSVDDVVAAAATVFGGPRVLSIVGPDGLDHLG